MHEVGCTFRCVVLGVDCLPVPVWRLWRRIGHGVEWLGLLHAAAAVAAAVAAAAVAAGAVASAARKLRVLRPEHRLRQRRHRRLVALRMRAARPHHGPALLRPQAYVVRRGGRVEPSARRRVAILRVSAASTLATAAARVSARVALALATAANWHWQHHRSLRGPEHRSPFRRRHRGHRRGRCRAWARCRWRAALLDEEEVGGETQGDWSKGGAWAVVHHGRHGCESCNALTIPSVSIARTRRRTPARETRWPKKPVLSLKKKNYQRSHERPRSSILVCGLCTLWIPVALLELI